MHLNLPRHLVSIAVVVFDLVAIVPRVLPVAWPRAASTPPHPFLNFFASRVPHLHSLTSRRNHWRNSHLLIATIKDECVRPHRRVSHNDRAARSTRKHRKTPRSAVQCVRHQIRRWWHRQHYTIVHVELQRRVRIELRAREIEARAANHAVHVRARRALRQLILKRRQRRRIEQQHIGARVQHHRLLLKRHLHAADAQSIHVHSVLAIEREPLELRGNIRIRIGTTEHEAAVRGVAEAERKSVGNGASAREGLDRNRLAKRRVTSETHETVNRVFDLVRRRLRRDAAERRLGAQTANGERVVPHRTTLGAHLGRIAHNTSRVRV